MMRKRDKAILEDLQKFRCMSRDDIVDLHFSHLSNKVGACNTVMKRLRRDGHVEVNVFQQPYIYFPAPSPIKRDSAKIPHFLKIVDFYKQLRKHSIPKIFEVEPKYGKEFMEPDAFMIWQGAPFFVEIQLSHYSQKVMKDKINRYEKYALSGKWKNESWQPANKKVFPYIWIIGDHHYNIESKVLRIFQSVNANSFLKEIKKSS